MFRQRGGLAPSPLPWTPPPAQASPCLPPPPPTRPGKPGAGDLVVVWGPDRLWPSRTDRKRGFRQQGGGIMHGGVGAPGHRGTEAWASCGGRLLLWLLLLPAVRPSASPQSRRDSWPPTLAPMPRPPPPPPPPGPRHCDLVPVQLPPRWYLVGVIAYLHCPNENR